MSKNKIIILNDEGDFEESSLEEVKPEEKLVKEEEPKKKSTRGRKTKALTESSKKKSNIKVITDDNISDLENSNEEKPLKPKRVVNKKKVIDEEEIVNSFTTKIESKVNEIFEKYNNLSNKKTEEINANVKNFVEEQKKNFFNRDYESARSDNIARLMKRGN